MLALPIVESPMPVAVFEEAAALYRNARRAGVTVRSGVDCLIAACAIRHRLTVLHHDRDFDLLAKIAPLEARKV
jgi:predicted nucleic acid-binding protein